jgi:pimeloyl-ACP methyl ester carboxylesterase
MQDTLQMAPAEDQRVVEALPSYGAYPTLRERVRPRCPDGGLHLDWGWPPRARFIEGLSSFCRLIRFDKRGTGLSDRPTTAATLEERTDDIRAVMDAAGSDRAAIFGVSEGGSIGVLFAATYPDKTRCLITWGCQARWVQTKDYPWGLTPEEVGRTLEMLRRGWPLREWLLGPGAGLGEDADQEFGERPTYLRVGTSSNVTL